jgi:hypothetical protein
MTKLEDQLEKEIKGYKKDKKYYRRIIKIMAITIAIAVIELILTLALGKEAIMLTVNLAHKIILKYIGG